MSTPEEVKKIPFAKTKHKTWSYLGIRNHCSFFTGEEFSRVKLTGWKITEWEFVRWEFTRWEFARGNS